MEILPPRRHTAPHAHESARSRPLAAAAAAMAAAASHDSRMSGGYGGHIDNRSAPVPTSERYVPPGGRHLSWPAGDNPFLRQRLADANATAEMVAAMAPRHLHDHPTAHGRSEWNHAPFARHPGLSANVPGSAPPPVPGFAIPSLATSAAAVVAAREVRPEAMDTETAPTAPGGWPRPITRDPLHPPFQLSVAATAFSMSTRGDGPVGSQAGPGASNGGVPAEEEEQALQQTWSQPSRPWNTAVMRQMAGLVPRGVPVGNSGGRGYVQRDGAFVSGGTATRAASTAADASVTPHLRQGVADPSLMSNRVGTAQDGRTQQRSRSSELQVVPISRMVALPPEGGITVTRGVGEGVRPDEATQEIQYQDSSQSNLATLPAFRHWEAQRARLRIQVCVQIHKSSPTPLWS